MVTDKFGTVLEELGKIYQTKLTPNQRGGCLIRYKNGLSIQLESDGDYVMLACEIAQMSQGRYRENIFREALKANGLAPSATNPRSGVFAYGKKNESLVLNDRFLLEQNLPIICSSCSKKQKCGNQLSPKVKFHPILEPSFRLDAPKEAACLDYKGSVCRVAISGKK
jgi:hypothetical protein